ncbi:hypothetical protein [Pontibacter liquoris]|uniref:hypothetical protein n=1 Tax=Pontibacter liquoris TaxID=2905677 RepID=UPI001FA7EF6A|nr:hypothetical protein [Pontibacter liquoris]
MKNLFRFPLAVMAVSLGLLATSCSQDDDQDTDVIPTPSGNTEYNGQGYTIKNGFYLNGGSLSLFGGDDTHYMDYFLITDGTPTIGSNGEVNDLQNGKIAILTPLFSAGGNSFKTGHFVYADLSADTDLEEVELEAKYGGKSFFFQTMVMIDSDGDSNWEEEADIEITGGTIDVSGSLPNLTMSYNLQTAGGKVLKGSYSGKFTLIEGDDDGEGLKPQLSLQ